MKERRKKERCTDLDHGFRGFGQRQAHAHGAPVAKGGGSVRADLGGGGHAREDLLETRDTRRRWVHTVYGWRAESRETLRLVSFRGQCK